MNGPPLTDGEPKVVGLRVRPGATIALFVLLGVSAAVALWSRGNPDQSPVWLEQGAPWIFLVFVVGFAAYRFALVAAHRYSAFKAFFQIFIAALFFMMLLPGSPLVNRPKAASLTGLLADPDARVRSLAAEVAGWRRDQEAAKSLVRLLDDPDPAVREQAHGALVRLNEGADLGSTSKEWKDRFP